MLRWFRSFGGRLQLAETHVNELACEDLEQISRLQLTQLERVWDDASKHIPYYRNMVNEGLAPVKFQSLKEFSEVVAIVSKKTMQKYPELFRREKEPDYRLKTAGSTGEPLQFGIWKSESTVASANMAAMRCYRGMDLARDHIFLIWGHAYLLGTGTAGKIKSYERKLKDRLLGYRRVDAYHIGRDAARRYFDIMMREKPKVVCGYSNAIDLFVRHNLDRSIIARDLRVKFIICTSEMLPRSDSREVIENFFNAPVMMEYGGVEFGSVAHNWQGSPYKVNWWDYFVESVARAGADSGDQLVITALYPRYLPLLRYDTGDEIANPRKGPDGEVVQFEYLLGRHHDVLLLDDGCAIHSMGFFHCIHQEPLVANIQLIVWENALQINLVGEPDEATVGRIRHRLADLHPQLANCTIEYTDDLITTAAGKRRWVIDLRPKTC